jgi:hypothetical protein
MDIKELYLHCQIDSGLLLAEAPAPLENPRILTLEGEEVAAPVLSRETLEDGLWRVRLDASQLFCWSPDTPVLYRFVADGGIDQRFGYCEIAGFQNKAVLFNGAPMYFRGVIRGIVAHDHPNMTGGSLFDAAVKYIRQAKKYGFNLVRFHSTIPWPEFVDAADQEGILIHAEIGFAYDRNEKGEKVGLSMDQSTWTETLKKYRNCPSMAIFCIGNEMHNSGRVPQVHALYEEGRRLAPGKLIIDNSGWGEYDRTSADIFSQHIAYFFPYGVHKNMFHVEDPWLINGSTYQVPFDTVTKSDRCQATVHRNVTPVRPTLAHEAVHYIEVPDYYALRKKFEDFCKRVGPEYLEANGIQRPRFLDELPELIERKGLLPRFPRMVKASEYFKMACLKQYLESCRFSALCGFEMLQFADCLKYENKNGIVDCFDDDKFIPAEWMRQFNGNAALLLQAEKTAFYWSDGLKATLHVSDFLPEPQQVGDLTVKLTYPDGTVETIFHGEKFSLVGGLQQLAELQVAFPDGPAKALTLTASFQTSEGLELKNEWPLWGFPKPELPALPANTLVTGSFNEALLQALEDGKTVLLTLPKAPVKGQTDFFFPGAREHCKPCIWDRGSDLGGVIESAPLREALGGCEFFDLRMESLLHDAYKINLDTFPGKVTEWIWGVDKPVRDRMKGLVFNVKTFIDGDTLRNFSHLFSVKVGKGTLVVCTLNLSLDVPAEDCVIRNFSAALLANLPLLAETNCSIEPAAFRAYLEEVKKKGPSKEDTMNHFWELDNKLVEDTLFWEEANLDLRKID